MSKINPHGRARVELAKASEKYGWKPVASALLVAVGLGILVVKVAVEVVAAFAVPMLLAGLALGAWHVLSRGK